MNLRKQIKGFGSVRIVRRRLKQKAPVHARARAHAHARTRARTHARARNETG